MRLESNLFSNPKRDTYELIKVLAFAILIALVINSFVVNAKVIGQSMNPNFQENDILVINKMAYMKNDYKYGDIIVFKSQERGNNLIKRVIGLPNDKIEIKDGKVYRNDVELYEPYIKEDYTSGNINLTVPQGSLFVLGDNRQNSLDSRSEIIGCVNFSDVIGKAIMRLFPNTGLIN